VRTLDRQGIKQSVLSATDQQNLNHMITHFGLNGLFSYVYGINNKKAESKVERGREMLDFAKVPPHRTVLVGDTLHDLEVAKDLGVHAMPRGYTARGLNFQVEWF